MHNIKVSKQSTKREKQRKGLTHIQTETKSNAKTLNKKIEQPQQQNKTKVENKNENDSHAHKSQKRNDQGGPDTFKSSFVFKLEKKKRKMTQQKPTALHKTPKPRASDTQQKNHKPKTHENDNKPNKKVGAVKKRVEMTYLS